MEKLKAILVAVWGAFLGFLGVLAVPVLLLVSCNLIDYITAFIACKCNGVEFESPKSLRGIAKKILMWLLVVVGAIVDRLIIYAAEVVQIKAPFKFLVACVVCIWLICNELISILENIKAAGVKLPPFLEPIIKNIKKQTEDAAKAPEEDPEETEKPDPEEQKEEKEEEGLQDGEQI